MSKIKPILFNTDMVRAILDGRKAVTRRVVKPQPKYATMVAAGLMVSDNPINVDMGLIVTKNGDVTTWDKLPYRSGDILYVRETWTKIDGDYVFKADDEVPEGWCLTSWLPSIHMPREAARIFLRVTEVRVERVQEIIVDEILAEGMNDVEIPPICKQLMDPNYPSDDQRSQWEKMSETQRDEYVNTLARHTYIGWCDYADRLFNTFARLWNALYAKPRPVKVKGIIDHYESYPWEDIRETRTYHGKPWYVIGNPWVWVIEFERCEKPEGD